MIFFSLSAKTQAAGPERPPQLGGVHSLPQPLERPSGPGLQGKTFFFSFVMKKLVQVKCFTLLDFARV